MGTKRAAPEINVTPLIDVLLVLLIIFMVITPLRPSRFRALVPNEPVRQKDLLPDPLTLVVSLDRAGALRLNGGAALGTPREMSRLSAALAELFEQRRASGAAFRRGVVNLAALPEAERIEKTVFVKAPRSVPYGEVARVIDGLKGVGANPVGLQIDDLDQ